MLTLARPAVARLLLVVLLLSSCTALRSPSLPPGTMEARVYVLSTTCLGVLTHAALLIQDFDAACPHAWNEFGFGDTTFMGGSAPWNYAYLPVLAVHNLVAPTQGALERQPYHIELRDVLDRAERERRVAEKTGMQAIELTVDAARVRDVEQWLETGFGCSVQGDAPGVLTDEAWSSYSLYHDACGDFVAHALFLLGVDIDPDRYLPRWLFWYRVD